VKWRTPYSLKALPPQSGDLRCRRVFLVWPRACEDGYTRLFEHVVVKERYSSWWDGGNWFTLEYRTLDRHYQLSNLEVSNISAIARNAAKAARTRSDDA